MVPTDLARDWLSCAPPGSRGPFLPAPSLLAASSPKPRSTRCIIDSVSRAPHPPCYFCLDPGSYKPRSSPPPPHPQQPNPETRTHRPAGRAKRRSPPPAHHRPSPASSAGLRTSCLLWLTQCLKPTAQRMGPCVSQSRAGRLGTILRSQEAHPGAPQRLALWSC